jgi:hypothetical protein
VHWDEPTPAVDYNLGTTLIHLDDLSGARLHLERAGYAAPGSDKIEENLEIVRRLVDLQRTQSTGGRAGRFDLEGDLYWWKISAGLEEPPLIWGAIAGLWLVFLGALGRHWWRHSTFRRPATWLAAVGLAASVFGGALYAGKIRMLRTVQPAVVTAEGAVELRSGPSDHAPSVRPVAPVRSGTMVRVYEEREGWLRVGVAGRSSGAVWLRAEAVERL